MISKKLTLKGFTLIELLIVIAIVSILAVVAFVSLDPVKRFADSRDSARWTDITGVLDAAKVHQVDNGGNYITAIQNLNAGSSYMIGTGPTCTDPCADASPAIVGCADLTALVTPGGYLAAVPKSPSVPGGTTRTAAQTGYLIRRASTGALTVAACDSEGAGVTSISVAR